MSRPIHLIWLVCMGCAAAGCAAQDGADAPESVSRLMKRSVDAAQDRRFRLPEPGEFMTPKSDILASDVAWFEQLRDVPIGQLLQPDGNTRNDERALANLGFLAGRAGAAWREADLIAEIDDMVLTDVPQMSEVDCVAIISIDRANGDTPYLYTTLRSIFRAFPRGTHVNVLVGDDNLGYVAEGRLTEEIGAENLPYVHIRTTSSETSAYLKAHLPANRRGGWNYTRALRSYHGTKGMILMEDDVEWATGSITRFNSWLRGRHLPAVSLFNDRCEILSGTKDHLSHGLTLHEVETEHWAFWSLQGMYYDAKIAGALGRWVQLRMHQAVYDNVIGYFFTDNRTRIAYAFPSIVQHIGRYTACDSAGFHTSSCYRDSF